MGQVFRVRYALLHQDQNILNDVLMQLKNLRKIFLMKRANCMSMLMMKVNLCNGLIKKMEKVPIYGHVP